MSFDWSEYLNIAKERGQIELTSRYKITCLFKGDLGVLAVHLNTYSSGGIGVVLNQCLKRWQKNWLGCEDFAGKPIMSISSQDYLASYE